MSEIKLHTSIHLRYPHKLVEEIDECRKELYYNRTEYFKHLHFMYKKSLEEKCEKN